MKTEHEYDARSRFYRQWLVSVSLGEAMGFAVPAFAAGLALALGAPQLGLTGAAIAAGAAEGAVLGWSQVRVLRRFLPAIAAASWVRATAAGALVAWALGFTTPTVADLFPDLGPRVLIPLSALTGSALVLSLSVAQWLVLRRATDRAGWWIPGNAVSWCLAVPVVFVAMALVPEDAGAAVFAGVGVVSGIAMAVIAAAATGWVMAKIIFAPPHACVTEIAAQPLSDALTGQR
ncbi:MAG TPA: hypothetical protein VJL07_04390 [Dehalococcoidia bacterium]|nr:hypothetical protein [Dehalococcoidia bacterium]